MPPSGLRSRNFAIGDIRPERFQELDLGVGQRDEHGGHAVRRLRHHGGNLGAERLAIDLGGLGDVAHRDGDVVEASDHEASPASARLPIPIGLARPPPVYCA